MKKETVKKLLAVVTLVVLVLALSGCSYKTHDFLHNGWDYEVDGVQYHPGLGPGIVQDEEKAENAGVDRNEDGSAGVTMYSQKGPSADGSVLDIDYYEVYTRG